MSGGIVVVIGATAIVCVIVCIVVHVVIVVIVTGDGRVSSVLEGIGFVGIVIYTIVGLRVVVGIGERCNIPIRTIA